MTQKGKMTAIDGPILFCSERQPKRCAYGMIDNLGNIRSPTRAEAGFVDKVPIQNNVVPAPTPDPGEAEKVVQRMTTYARKKATWEKGQELVVARGKFDAVLGAYRPFTESEIPTFDGHC